MFLEIAIFNNYFVLLRNFEMLLIFNSSLKSLFKFDNQHFCCKKNINYLFSMRYSFKWFYQNK